MKYVETCIRNFLKRHKNIRKQVRRIYVFLKSHWYKKLARSFEIDDKLILFETFMGRQYSCNPRAIYEYMMCQKKFDDYRFVWVFKDLDKKNQYKKLERANIVLYGSKEYYRCFASAKYVVTNSNIDYAIQKKETQIFLQTWHGTPLKKLRCDIEAELGNANNSLDEIRIKNDLDVVRYDYFISPSSFASNKFKSAFNLENLGKENIIIETGYPRNDFLINYTQNDIERILYDLGIETDKKILLYAPTYRDNQHKSGIGYVYDLRINFDNLKEQISDEYIILFRAHYFIANQFNFDKYNGFVYDVSDFDDITNLYLISDMLLTDYSSAVFDYANLKKPILFYMYDFEEYSDDVRGFYIDINELPGKIIKDEYELINVIKNEHFVYDEKYKRFNNKYNYLDDGQASKRVVDIILR